MNAELLNELFANVDWLDIWLASQDTLIMVGVSLVFTIAFGLPLGVLLFLTSRQQLLDSPRLYRVLAFMTNLLRSLPFVILLIAMIPITVLLTGTSIGVAGVIPPLVIGATPFFARLVETALREVDRGIIEASQAMGASTRQIVLKALLPEALNPAPTTSEALATSAAQPTEVERPAGENMAQPAGETGAPSPEGAPATSSGQTPGALLPTPSAATTTEPGASSVLEGAAVEQGGKLTGTAAPSPSAVMSGEQPSSPAPAEPASTAPAPATPSAASPTGDGVPAK